MRGVEKHDVHRAGACPLRKRAGTLDKARDETILIVDAGKKAKSVLAATLQRLEKVGRVKVAVSRGDRERIP